MFTRALRQVANWYRSGGSGRSAGRSSDSNRACRLPSIFWNGRALISATHSLIAAFASATEKNLRSRSRAMIHRSASRTPDSALALSRGLYARAGMTAIW